jgi:energy-coupling factor transporter ATP-binding protein EcfA2
MNSDIIEIHHVRRAFGRTVAVQNLNLRVRRGSIYGFLGRNGAGKTTPIKMLAGLLWPDEGKIKVNGVEPARFTVADRWKILAPPLCRPAPFRCRRGNGVLDWPSSLGFRPILAGWERACADPFGWACWSDSRRCSVSVKRATWPPRSLQLGFGGFGFQWAGSNSLICEALREGGRASTSVR